MKIQQLLFNSIEYADTIVSTDGFDPNKAQLVLAFGERTTLEKSPHYQLLRNLYPNSDVVFCSTSGQISNESIVNDKVVSTAIQFEKTTIKVLEVDIQINNNIEDLGKKIQYEIFTNDLKSILILSEGSFINGTELINELITQTKGTIPIFGGLAGDEFNFEKTIVGLNSEPSQGKIVCIGFYGKNIHFGFGCEGGWSDFGPEREVTVSDKNVLYKIGDRYALDLYKEYLGNYADELPGSSLYFPLSMKENKDDEAVVRTILAIDEENKSMTFAGNIPQGSYVRLMKANFDKLIEASYDAASSCLTVDNEIPKLALMVSCVGRKIVLGNRIEEEIEVVKDVFGSNVVLAGFYSYGEISPTLQNVACELHNQTMTITLISES